FDNNADVLSVSPMLTERYLSAARKISQIAVGDPAIHPITETFAVNKYLKQDDRLSEDFPFASRGGVAAHYYFPVNGDFFVKVFLLRTYDGRIRGLIEPNQLEVPSMESRSRKSQSAVNKLRLHRVVASERELDALTRGMARKSALARRPVQA